VSPTDLKLIFKDAGTKKSSLIILIPLLLSSVTHLWNLTGFPPVYMDEDIYIRKALKAIQGITLEDDRSNPVYGWLILSLALGTVGFPNSLHQSPDGGVHSVEMLYLVPRAFIGILGILDTFLIYKIIEHYYRNRNAALIGSVLFAVMPMTWLTRYILLETIQLPFLLASIFFVVYAVRSQNSTAQSVSGKLPLILLSGAFLGLSIFIKFPTFAMIPFIGFLIFRSYRSVKILGLWFIPILLMPLIAPVYANSFGMFHVWWDGIAYQVHRGKQPLFDFTGKSPNNAINILFRIDPVLMTLGIIGLITAAIKRDLFPILWTVPYIILYYSLGYVAYYHFIPIYPALCIAIAKLILDLLDKIKNITKKTKQIILFSTISVIVIFGFTCTLLLITTNVNSTHFEAAAVISKHLADTKTPKDNGKSLTLIMGESRFYWILKYAFLKDFDWASYWTYKSSGNETGKVVMLVEPGAFHYWNRTEADKKQLKEVHDIYDNSHTILVLKRDLDAYIHGGYPYSSMNIENLGIGKVEIRANSEGANLFSDLKNSSLSVSSMNTQSTNHQR